MFSKYIIIDKTVLLKKSVTIAIQKFNNQNTLIICKFVNWGLKKYNNSKMLIRKKVSNLYL